MLKSDLFYPAPRWKPLAWFVRSGRAPIPEIENGLRSTLFRRMSSLVAVSISNTTMMLVVMWRHPSGFFLLWAVMGCSMDFVRFAAIMVIRRAIARRTLHRARYVVDIYVATTLTWSLQLGLGCFLCLWSGDIVVMIFSIVMSVGVIGAVSGRNPGCPRLSVVQMMLIYLPLTAGLLITSEPGLQTLAVLCPPYLWGMWSINSQLHDDYIAMLSAQFENRRRALHCGLTGLPNVSHFYEKLTEAIALQHASPVAVLALDLDGFKAVNDCYGHPVGDALLKSVAERILKVESPTVLGARIGGDEFAVVLQGPDAEGAEAVAARLIDDISRPHSLGNLTAEIGVSIGIARCWPNTVTPAALHVQADRALYRAKAAGKGQWCVCTDDASDRVAETSPSSRSPESRLDDGSVDAGVHDTGPARQTRAA